MTELSNFLLSLSDEDQSRVDAWFRDQGRALLSQVITTHPLRSMPTIGERVLVVNSPLQTDVIDAVDYPQLLELAKRFGSADKIEPIVESRPLFHKRAPALVITTGQSGAENIAISADSVVVLPNAECIRLGTCGRLSSTSLSSVTRSKEFIEWSSRHGPGSTFQWCIKSEKLAKEMLERDPATAVFAQDFLDRSDIEAAVRSHPLPRGLERLGALPQESKAHLLRKNPYYLAVLAPIIWSKELLADVIDACAAWDAPYPTGPLFDHVDVSAEKAALHPSFAKHLGALENFPLSGGLMNLVINQQTEFPPRSYPEPGRSIDQIHEDLTLRPRYVGSLLRAGRLPDSLYREEHLKHAPLGSFSHGDLQRPGVLDYIAKNRTLVEVAELYYLLDALGSQRILKMNEVGDIDSYHRSYYSIALMGGANWPQWLTPEVGDHLLQLAPKILVRLCESLLSITAPRWALEGRFKDALLERPSAKVLKILSDRDLLTQVEADRMVRENPSVFANLPARCHTQRSREIAVAHNPSFLKKIHQKHRTERLLNIAARIEVAPPPGADPGDVAPATQSIPSELNEEFSI